MLMRMLLLDTSPETRGFASFLLPILLREKSNYIHEGLVINFNKAIEDPFKTVRSAQDLSSFFCLGRSDQTKIGDFDAESFARKFKESFEGKFKNPEDKYQVKDIYLIRCATDLASKTDTLAQDIADEMYISGFNVRVHAVASPHDRDAKYVSMRIEAIQEASISNTKITGSHVQAFLLTKEQDEELTRLDAKIDKFNQQYKLLLSLEDKTSIKERKEILEKIRGLMDNKDKIRARFEDRFDPRAGVQRIGNPMSANRTIAALSNAYANNNEGDVHFHANILARKLTAELNESKTERRKIINKAHIFLETNDIKTVLTKPVNTVISKKQETDIVAKALKTYAGQLDREHKSSSWLARNTWNKIKLDKIVKLKMLATKLEQNKIKIADLAKLYAKGSSEYDAKLIHGTFSHRTLYLLQNCVTGHPEYGTENPADRKKPAPNIKKNR